LLYLLDRRDKKLSSVMLCVFVPAVYNALIFLTRKAITWSGNDSGTWFGYCQLRVRCYRGIYDGIDVRYYGAAPTQI
jgi:hypothetical protein